ncbi:MFS transporter [Xylophilus sp. GW821-FHT01B05]
MGTLIAGHVCLHATMAGSRMAAPLLALDQGQSTAAAGILVALFALTQVFLSLPAGRYADRHGLKRPVGLSVAVACAGAALAAAWPVYWVLCLAALMCGGAIGAATIALQRHIGRLARTPAELKQVFSWLSIAPAASNFVGPFVAGIMIDQFGFRAAFALLAALPLLAWTLMRRTRELPLEPARAGPRPAVWDLLRDSAMRRLLLMNWFMNSSWDLHAFMVPVLGHERGLPASVIGGILGAFAISAALVRVAMPLFAERLREWVLITAATGISGVLFALYPFAPSAAAMGVCAAALGLTLGTVQPMVMSMLHQMTPKHRHGEALALRLMLVNLSSVGMPLMFGAVGGVLGAGGVFWAMGSVLGLGSTLGFGLRGRGEGAQDH